MTWKGPLFLPAEMVDSYLFLIGSQLTTMSTGKVERDGECVFKLNEVDAVIQKESVVDGKEAKLEEIIMKINKINKNMNDKRYKTVSHLNVFMKKMKEVTVEIDAFNDEYVKHCPRCIEDHDDEDGKRVSGSKVVSSCEDCGVCEDCEHMIDCEVVKKDEKKLCSTCHINGSRVMTSCPDCGVVIFGGLSDSGKIELLKDMKEQTRIDIEKDFKDMGVDTKKKKKEVEAKKDDLFNCVYIMLVGESYYKTVIELGTYDESKLFDLYELIVPRKTKEFPHSVTFGGLKSVQHAVYGVRPNDLASLIYGGDLCGDIIVLDGDDEEEDAGSLAKMQVIADGLKKYLEMKRNENK